MESTAFWIVVWTVLAVVGLGALALFLYVGALAARARRTVRETEQTLFHQTLHDAGPVSAACERNVVRAYALAAKLSVSDHASRALPPRATTQALVSCDGGQHDQVATSEAVLRNPRWLVSFSTRSSRALHADVRNGLVQYVLVQGHPCHIRVAGSEERSAVHEYAQGAMGQKRFAQQHELFVVGDVRDVRIPSLPSPSSSSPSSPTSCAHATVHPFPAPPPEEWAALFGTRARSEEDAGASATAMHVWGYTPW